MKNKCGHLGTLGAQREPAQMADTNLNEEMKLRIKTSWRRAIEKYAEQDDCPVAQIMRRALNEYIQRRQRRKAR